VADGAGGLQTATTLVFYLGITYAIEKVFHMAEHSLEGKKEWFGVALGLEAVKHEFFLLGFVSMMLIALSGEIAGLCVKSTRTLDVWAPCPSDEYNPQGKDESYGYAASAECGEGRESFVDVKVLHDIHYLIFALGVFQVLCTFATMGLGYLTLNGRAWKKYETDSQNDKPLPGKTGTYAIRSRVSVWAQEPSKLRTVEARLMQPRWRLITCLFTHFVSTVDAEKYKILRGIFINNNMNKSLYNKFDYRKFLHLALQQDFSNLMRLSLPMWSILIVYVFLQGIQGSFIHFWFTFLGLATALLVGAKMSVMTIEFNEGWLVWQGETFRVENKKVYEELLWFKSPKLLQAMVKFVIFHTSLLLADVSFFYFQTNKDDLSCWHHVMGTGGKWAIMKALVALVQLAHVGSVLTPVYAILGRLGTLNVAEEGHMLASMEHADEIGIITNSWALKLKKTKAKAAKKAKDKKANEEIAAAMVEDFE